MAQGLEPSLALRDQTNVEKLQNGEIDLGATGDPALPGEAAGRNGTQRVLRFHDAQLVLALNKQTADETVAKLQAALEPPGRPVRSAGLSLLFCELHLVFPFAPVRFPFSC